MGEIEIVGFDKKIHYAWMDAVAYWASQGLAKEEVKSNIDSLLTSRLSDTGKRSSMSKVKSILTRTWLLQNDHLDELRRTAYVLYPQANENEKLLLQWGLSGATYPFFYQVAEYTGRLLSITQEVRSRQILRRLKERYGERATLDYAVSRVLRSFLEWGILEKGEKPHVLKSAGRKRIPRNRQLISWFVEANLRATGKQMVPFSSIIESPAVFPFLIETEMADVDLNPRLAVYRQNVDDDMIMLKG